MQTLQADHSIKNIYTWSYENRVNCMLGNNRIAGLFTVLFISNACNHLLQQPKPSILSFIATFVQAENCTEYCSVLFIYFPKVISCNNRFNCQQNTWL